MIRSKKIDLLLIASFFAAIFVTSLYAEENCVHCPGVKELEGRPAANGIDKVITLAMSAMTTMTSEKKDPIMFNRYLSIYCKRYIRIERNELPGMFQELQETEYPIKDYFQEAACYPEKVGGITSPILHLTAEAPCSRVDYPRIIHDIYKGNPEIWERAVNAKNSLGETYLDYIESLIRQGEFTTNKSKECVNKLINFACSTKPPGIYSMFKKDKSCPSLGNLQ